MSQLIERAIPGLSPITPQYQPLHHTLSSFFLGCLFIAAARHLTRSFRIASFPSRFVLRRSPPLFLYKSSHLPDIHFPQHSSVLSRKTETEITSQPQPRHSKHVVNTLTALYAISAIFALLSLLEFNRPSGNTFCMLSIVVCGLCWHFAQVVGLYAVHLDLRHLGVRRLESIVFPVILLLLSGAIIADQVLSSGATQTIPELNGIAICSRQQLVLVSALSSALMLATSIFAFLRLYSVLGLGLSGLTDIGVARALGLVLSSILTVVSGVVVTNALAYFIPLVIGGTVVMALFNHDPPESIEGFRRPFPPGSGPRQTEISCGLPMQSPPSESSPSFSESSHKLPVISEFVDTRVWATQSVAQTTLSEGPRNVSQVDPARPPKALLYIPPKVQSTSNRPTHTSAQLQAQPNPKSSRYIVPRDVLLSDLESSAANTRPFRQSSATSGPLSPGPIPQTRTVQSHRPVNPPPRAREYPYEVAPNPPIPSDSKARVPHLSVVPSISNAEIGFIRNPISPSHYNASPTSIAPSSVLGSDIVRRPRHQNTFGGGRNVEDASDDELDVTSNELTEEGPIGRYDRATDLPRSPGSFLSSRTSSTRTAKSKGTFRSNHRSSTAPTVASENAPGSKRRTFGESSFKRMERWSRAPTISSTASRSQRPSLDHEDPAIEDSRPPKDRNRGSSRHSKSSAGSHSFTPEPVPPVPELRARPLPSVPTNSVRVKMLK